MRDYDDTLGYQYWKSNTMGYDRFDEHHSAQSQSESSKASREDEFEEKYGGHTYYFNTMSFDWDDSRDWISFSKQTTTSNNNIASAKLEEVGAHPDKLEEVGAHPKQADVNNGGSLKETNKGSKEVSTPSRSYTKCTGAIPFIHKHACVTIGDDDAKVQLTSATKEEINILYNGLDDIFNEMDDEYYQNDLQQDENDDDDQQQINALNLNVNNAMIDEVEFLYFVLC